ncbi:MAG TPA: TonB-dependent receptor [Planctomycetota bacterium]|nr:TonB-dependent receptor [Planctomycetota bacterium]
MGSGSIAVQSPPPTPQDQKPETKSQEKKPETQLKDVEVIEQLNQARNQIVPDLGATTYTLSRDNIETLPMGLDAPFNQVILRMPGVAADGFGQLHVRGEHANLQYRINDVLLPEGITGFGQELDSRFMDSVRLITGSLPAQYGFRTAGIVDITTREGVLEPGGEISLYGGSYGTWRPSVDYGATVGKFSFFTNFSFDHNEFGIDNTTRSRRPLHDDTNQAKGFAYGSYILNDTSRITVMSSASYSTFQVPDTPGVAAGVSPGPLAIQWVPGFIDTGKLNNNQSEQNYYGVVAYQKKIDNLNFQVAAFGRSSAAHFVPDTTGELYLNGVASNVNRTVYSGGVQGDGSYDLKNGHIVRAGLAVIDEGLVSKSNNRVFPTDANGDPTGPAFNVSDNGTLDALFYGLYLQDEWKIAPQFTLNFGTRFDVAAFSFDHENQLSPRVNMIWQPTDLTSVHAGYARYFTPPPFENVRPEEINKFVGTSNEPTVTTDDPIKAERSNYFDVGISQKVLAGLQVGLDGYYKLARNQIDDGFFGQTLLLSTFNYRKGKVEGLELTANYNLEGFSSYANVAYSVAKGKGIHTAEFLFDPAKVAYSQDHYIFLDHDQTVTSTVGASYQWKESFGTTRPFVDWIFGTGLRRDGTDSVGNVIPNGDHVPAYYTFNLGVEQTYKVDDQHTLKARIDAINIADRIYFLRDGTGIGVNAAQFEMRRGFFGSLSVNF